MKLVIAGGAGTLGREIAKCFSDKGYEVVVLSRRKTEVQGARVLLWDGSHIDSSWGTELKDSVLLNLCGELVDRIPTEENIRLLETSRVEPTRALTEASNKFGEPALWMQMSTLAIYGDAGDVTLSEDSAVADGPRQMAGVAKAWEAAAADSPAYRKVFLRTGVVLESGTPALTRLVTMTKWLLGGTVSKGNQWVSWIDYRDFVRAMEFIIVNVPLTGVVHVTNPNPVTNRDLMRSLRRALHRPWTPATPAFMVRIGAEFIFKTDPLLALTGRKAIPTKLLDQGFVFEVNSIEDAIQ